MQFTDIVFALFFGVYFCLYWFVFAGKLKMQNISLLCASYIFYGWWDWRFLILIVLTSFSTWSTALLFERYRRRWLIYSNVVLNLGILVLFKYFNFFSENLARLFELFGVGLDWFTVDVLLPVGISFYTFQAIGYSIDVMHGKVRPTRDAAAFFTFIAFFPQLVAGPIESARSLLPQILHARVWSTPRAVRGLRMVLFGVLKKVCVADMLAIYSDRLFSAPDAGPLEVLAGGVVFTFQLYCDFSAYSEIARGCASLLGIDLMVNFRFPLLSRNIIEFWQRWHISLMLWFKEYVYIPLGGNRKGRARTVANYSIVFLLSGLWHGAAWNFIVWGAYWAVCYVAGRYVLKLERHPGERIALSQLPRILLTFGVVSFGFYIFRCPDMERLLGGFRNVWIYAACFGLLWLIARAAVALWRAVEKRARLSRQAVAWAALLAAVACVVAAGKGIYLLKFWWIVPALLVAAVEWRDRNGDCPFETAPAGRLRRYALYWAMATMIVLSEPTEMAFIYFQF